MLTQTQLEREKNEKCKIKANESQGLLALKLVNPDSEIAGVCLRETYRELRSASFCHETKLLG